MKERETRLISIENRFSPITEQYRNVRTSIQFASSSGQPLKLLLVTSTEQEEKPPLRRTWQSLWRRQIKKYY